MKRASLTDEQALGLLRQYAIEDICDYCHNIFIWLAIPGSYSPWCPKCGMTSHRLQANVMELVR